MQNIVKWRRIGLGAADAVVVAAALLAAYYLRFDYLFRDNWNQFLAVVPVFIIIRLTLFWAFRLYRGILRYASLGEMLAIVASVLLGTVILTGLNIGIQQIPILTQFPWLSRYIPVDDNINNIQRIPMGVLALEAALTIFGVAAIRFSRRILIFQVLRIAEETGTQRPRRLLIVGAGDLAEAAIRQIFAGTNRTWKPVAIVDEDADKRALRIHGIPVVGALADIPEVTRRYAVEDVLIAVRTISPEQLREIVTMCEHANVRFQILPSMQDVMSGRVSLNQIRPVEIEDLLGREPIELELPDERNYVRDQVVMITGAGGSIGSELCRQLVGLQPKRIILYGHGENSIYEISQEMGRMGVRHLVSTVIGDIRDLKKLQAVVAQYQPTIFFHAAAHKHVPLMEEHPDEAIKNNVGGTRNVALVAQEAGARKFILISSDKAVRPTNVMGATKRVAEMLVFSAARRSTTQFVAVRFGNVLGSRGSVVPLFRRQIAAGGPVTLTHPEVVRFFMTIPEAVSLVIQAGSMEQQGHLFLLDMGTPVRIVDLARNLIRLSGFEPEKEIAIVYTGLRPGEKMKEELLTAGENVRSTDMGKIFVTEPEQCDEMVLASTVEELLAAAEAGDHEEIRSLLGRLVPDYGPEPDETEAVSAAAATMPVPSSPSV